MVVKVVVAGTKGARGLLIIYPKTDIQVQIAFLECILIVASC